MLGELIVQAREKQERQMVKIYKIKPKGTGYTSVMGDFATYQDAINAGLTRWHGFLAALNHVAMKRESHAAK